MKLRRIKGFLFDFKLLVLLIVFYSVFEIIYLVKILYFLRQNQRPWPEHFAGLIFIDWILVISFMTFIAITTKRLVLKKVQWIYIFAIHFFLSILFSVFLRVAFDSYLLWSDGLSIWQFNIQKFLNGFMGNLEVNYIVYVAMLLMIYSYYYRQEIIKNEVQKEILKSQLLSNRLKMLTTQLQPHFLFNTLNGISSLIAINKKQAQDMIADLGSFLGEILYQSNSTFTTVEKEIALLEKFCNILKTRYWGRLTIEQHIQESVLKMKMPAMILQPIIENATKHGFDHHNSQLTITISAYIKNGLLFIDIENNGKALEYGRLLSNKGVGLANLKERLKNIYGNNAHFTIKNRENDSGIICSIAIPIEEYGK